MGNRANIVIDFGKEGSVVFYTHWGGFEATSLAVAKALQDVPGRWNDSSYLARAIFDRLVGDEQMSETGFGISPSLWDNDNENPIITVRTDTQTIEVTDKVFTFEEFKNSYLRDKYDQPV